MPTALRAMLGAAFFLSLGVRAHHSIVVHYDPTDIRSMAGTLESVTWTNPHSKWVFSVKNDEGVVETWRAEGDAVNTLERNGLTKEHFQVGSGITVIGPVARSGRNEMIAAQVVVGGVTYGIFPALADELSEELPQESQQTLTSAAGYEISYSPAPNLFRVWTPVDFPATGVRPQEIALTDGKALVVETTGIDYPYYNDAGVPLTRSSVVTERYSIRADGRRMDWSATTVDPTVFNSPTVISGWAVWAPAIAIRNFECVFE
jgi:hypothetical protein